MSDLIEEGFWSVDVRKRSESEDFLSLVRESRRRNCDWNRECACSFLSSEDDVILVRCEVRWNVHSGKTIQTPSSSALRYGGSGRI